MIISQPWGINGVIAGWYTLSHGHFKKTKQNNKNYKTALQFSESELLGKILRFKKSSLLPPSLADSK